MSSLTIQLLNGDFIKKESVELFVYLIEGSGIPVYK